MDGAINPGVSLIRHNKTKKSIVNTYISPSHRADYYYKYKNHHWKSMLSLNINQTPTLHYILVLNMEGPYVPLAWPPSFLVLPYYVLLEDYTVKSFLVYIFLDDILREKIVENVEA